MATLSFFRLFVRSFFFRPFSYFFYYFFLKRLRFDKIKVLAIPQLTTREQSRCSVNFYVSHWKNANTWKKNKQTSCSFLFQVIAIKVKQMKQGGHARWWPAFLFIFGTTAKMTIKCEFCLVCADIQSRKEHVPQVVLGHNFCLDSLHIAL